MSASNPRIKEVETEVRTTCKVRTALSCLWNLENRWSNVVVQTRYYVSTIIIDFYIHEIYNYTSYIILWSRLYKYIE